MELSNLAKAFKALSNEQRLKLFVMLYKWASSCKDRTKGGTCCCEPVDKSFSKACEKLDISRSTVSHHFKELASAGLISCSRNGRTFVCRINEDAIDAIRGFV